MSDEAPTTERMEAKGEPDLELRVALPESPTANVWLEVTRLENKQGGPGWGLGDCLWSPSRNRRGAEHYRTMMEARSGDLVLHSVDRQLAGLSFVASPCRELQDEPPEAGPWANRAPYYWVKLENFTPFPHPVPLGEFLEQNHRAIREDDSKTLYYPFTERNGKMITRQGGYLCRCSPRLYSLIRGAVLQSAAGSLSVASLRSPRVKPRIESSTNPSDTSEARTRHEAEDLQSPSVHGPVRSTPEAPTLAPSASSLLFRNLRSSEPTEAEFLVEARQLAKDFGLSIPDDTLATIHLAATTRPFVLLAGPPGLGKTTLAQFYAGLLGCAVDDHTLTWLTIQAHWINDDPLIELPSSPISHVCALGAAHLDLLQSVLLDEFNLTRPEYYLARYFSALESSVALNPISGLVLPRTADGHPRVLTFATINIDENSRPPSDKILDRTFLIEPAELQRSTKLRRPRLQLPTHRLSAETWAAWRPDSREIDVPTEFAKVLEIFDDHSRRHPTIIHESLSPSRRAIHDVCMFMQRYEQLGEDALGMTRAQALDRALTGRILPRLRGEVLTLRELLANLTALLREQEWTGSLRHIEAIQKRVEFGFVSFWG